MFHSDQLAAKIPVIQFHWHVQGTDGAIIVEAPGEYPFHIYDKPSQRSGGLTKFPYRASNSIMKVLLFFCVDPVYSITLSVSNLTKSLGKSGFRDTVVSTHDIN